MLKNKYIFFLFVLMFACKSNRNSEVEQLIEIYMNNNSPSKTNYEPCSTNLVDSIMVDSAVFSHLPKWDKSTPLTNILYKRRSFIDLPLKEEDLSEDDLDKSKKNILAYYVYNHSYNYKEKGRTSGTATLFIFDPRKHKVYKQDPDPIQTITKKVKF